MYPHPLTPTRTDPLFPYTSLFRSPSSRSLAPIPADVRVGKMHKTPAHEVGLQARAAALTPLALGQHLGTEGIDDSHDQLTGEAHGVIRVEPERLRDAVRSRRALVGGGSLVEKPADPPPSRSEEHTSELQSLMRISYAVFCLKKKKSNQT